MIRTVIRRAKAGTAKWDFADVGFYGVFAINPRLQMHGRLTIFPLSSEIYRENTIKSLRLRNPTSPFPVSLARAFGSNHD